MTVEERARGPLDGAAATLCWTSALAGIVLPVASMMLAGRRSPAQVLTEFWQSFAGAEPGLAFATALHAVPFWIFAVFALLHLGRIPAGDAALGSRRLGGALGALGAMTGASLWLNTAIFASRSSTAAIGFIFLPAYLLAALALGYALGRAAVRVVRR
jgi:hypothetical protein